MSRSSSLGNLRVDLTANSVQFVGTIEQARKLAQQFAQTATDGAAKHKTAVGVITGGIGKIAGALTSLKALAIGTFAAIGVTRFIGQFQAASNTVDDLGKKAKRLGLSAQGLGVLRFAAGQSGLEFDTLAKLASKAQKNVAEFSRTGKGEAADALRTLKIQTTDVNGQVRDFADLLPDIAIGLQKLDASTQLELATKIFGREGGDQFIQWLTDSGDLVGTLGEKAEQARRLGVVFTDDQIKKLTAYNDAVDRVGEAWLGLRVKVMTQVAPALTDLADKAAAFVAALPTMVSNVVQKVRDAVGGGANAIRARVLFANLGQDALAFASDLGYSVARLFLAGLVDVLAVAPTVLKPIAKQIGLELVRDITQAAMEGLLGLADFLGDREKRLAGVTAQLTQLEAERARLEEALNSTTADDVGVLQQQLSSLNAEIARTKAAQAPTIFEKSQAGIRGFGTALTVAMTMMRGENKATAESTEDFVQRLNAAWEKTPVKLWPLMGRSLEEINNSGAAVLKDLDDIAGASQAILDHSMTNLPKVRGEVDKNAQALSRWRRDWADFKAGWKQGVEELAKDAGTITDLGRNIATSVGQGVAGGTAEALADAEMGVKNFGSSMRAVAKGVERDVLIMVQKMILLRAVSMALGSIFPAQLQGTTFGTPTSNGPGGTTPDFGGGGVPNTAMAAHGLAITGGRVVNLAHGGVLGGLMEAPLRGGGKVRAGERGANTEVGFAPLVRHGADLGVGATPANVSVEIYDQRSGGEPAKVQESKGPDGERVLRVFIRDEVKKGLQGAEYDKVLDANFGIRRQGAAR